MAYIPDSYLLPDIQRSFDEVSVRLSVWLHGQLFRHAGQSWWKNNVCGVLSNYDLERVDKGEWKELKDLDFQGLLKVLRANFRFLSSKRSLPRESRDTIRQTLEARNYCVAHRPARGNLPEEIKPHLESLLEFAQLISASKSTLEHIELTIVKTAQPKVTDSQVLTTVNHQPPPTEVDLALRLRDFYADTELTSSQVAAVTQLQDFLDDPDSRCFILKGYAGTGKTFLIGGLIRYFKACHRHVSAMAPTGRAAHVLQERHQVDARTIHRNIYGMERLKQYKEVDENGDITFKFYFSLKNNDSSHDTVFLVDEASMIADDFSEAEFMHFGSGRLLSDLVSYINFDANDYRKKLILIGDDAQLPPVNEKISPALSTEYLEKKLRLKSSLCELTDVVRQQESSLVLKNATALRDMLKTSTLSCYDFQSDGDSIQELSPTPFIDHFAKNRDASTPNKSVIITYKNASAKNYNQAVRKRLYPNQLDITDGDQIIVVKNNYNYERDILNGQMGIVKYSATETEIKTVILNLGLDHEGKRKNERIDLTFRNVCLSFTDPSGETFDLNCKILENCLESRSTNIPSEVTKALYVDFLNRHKNLNPSDNAFRDELLADPYFNAVMIKFGYAITCHKAQGGEWDTVYIDFEDQNKLQTQAIRWSYTAVTRAANNIVATNALHQGILTPIKKAPKQPLVDSKGQPTANHATPRTILLQLLREQLPTDWSIDEKSGKSAAYNETLTIIAPSSVALNVTVYYKGNHSVTRGAIQPSGHPQEEQQLVQILAALKGQYLVANNNGDSSLNETHQQFIEHLREKYQQAEVKILQSDSKSEYHLKVSISHGTNRTMMNYYFDSERRFKSMRPDPGCPPVLLSIIEPLH